MQTEEPTDADRFKRFVASIGLIGAVGIAIGAVSRSEGMPVFLTVGLYVGYLAVSGLLITLIAGRLFQQHGVRKFKIDLANMLLLTTLFALPLGASNGFVWIILNSSAEDISNDAPAMTIVFAAFLLFMMFPTFLVIEAALAWWVKPKRRD